MASAQYTCRRTFYRTCYSRLRAWRVGGSVCVPGFEEAGSLYETMGRSAGYERLVGVATIQVVYGQFNMRAWGRCVMMKASVLEQPK